MSKLISSRVMLVVFALGCFSVLLPGARAQEDPNDIPLGDVARSFRKKVGPPEVVIDNDNFSKVVEEAESHRTAGTTMTFTLDPGAKNFHVSTPDASCTLSFTAKASALLSDPIMLDELPRDEMAKLDGPATIDGDSLQLSIHNGSAWDLREIVVGLTIVRTPDAVSVSSQVNPEYYGPARVLPAIAIPQVAHDPAQKLQDTTILLHMKGSAAPAATAVFRTQLNFALFPDQEWHWAIIRAKGVPPSPTGIEVAQPTAPPPTMPAPVISQTGAQSAARQSPDIVQTSTPSGSLVPAAAQSPANR
jgi:hypothetical protein